MGLFSRSKSPVYSIAEINDLLTMLALFVNLPENQSYIDRSPLRVQAVIERFKDEVASVTYDEAGSIVKSRLGEFFIS